MVNFQRNWQCVFLLWGEKYNANDVIQIADAIALHAANPPQFVLLTDKKRDDVPEHIIQNLIPSFYLQPQFTSGGCQATLAVFQHGVLPAELPTVLVDLDTAILGDISRLFSLLTAKLRVAMIANSPLSLCGFSRIVYQLSKGRIRTRGNSSFLVFNPAACYDIDETFRNNFASQIASGNKAYVADDKFISATYHQEIVAIPTSLAVKFPREFMQKIAWLGYLKTLLPWARRRRANLLAITFPGSYVDVAKMRSFSDGDQMQDGRGRWLIWSYRYLGDTKTVLNSYFALSKKQ